MRDDLTKAQALLRTATVFGYRSSAYFSIRRG